MRCLDEALVSQARAGLGDADSVAIPYPCRLSGKTGELFLISDSAAEELASTLGHFGGALAVKIFAAVLRTDLCECDIATLVGGEDEQVLAELDRLERRGFLVRREEENGTTYFGWGNPPLRKFFLNRLTEGRTLARLSRASEESKE